MKSQKKNYGKLLSTLAKRNGISRKIIYVALGISKPTGIKRFKDGNYTPKQLAIVKKLIRKYK